MCRIACATLLVILAAFESPVFGAEPAAPAAKPNIVLILADDYGLDGVGCYGSDRFKGKTPNLDRLAETGIRFERCYSTPLCGPTRCLLMTGRYGFRTGGLTNQSARLPAPANEVSVANVLKQAGYATCCTGKWRQMQALPGDWGFDHSISDPTAGGWYWQKSYFKNGQEVTLDKEVYCPDVCQEFALEFLRQNRDRPFFLYFPTHLVHGPILRTPDTKPGADRDQLYDDNVAYLDKQVGRLVEEIDRLKLREKTVIFFTADNGTAGQSRTIHGRPINGHKGTMGEGGARVPLIANWKGTAPAGKVLQDLVDHSDFLPTLADLAGAKLPEGVVLDGTSFAPQLCGRPGKPREWVFVQLGAQWYVRDDGWKLNQRGELFDMSGAPFEEKPVAADSQDPKAVAARKRLQAVLDQLNPAGGKTEPPGLKAKKAAKPKRAKKRAQAEG
jgi:arylsulfatase A